MRFSWNHDSCLFVGLAKALARLRGRANAGSKDIMQKRKSALAGMVMVATLLYPPCALAQTSGGSGAHGDTTGAQTTTGIASDQAHISPPGTNALGTANPSDVLGSGTVGANMEPTDSQSVDAKIRAEDAKIDAKIKNICRGC
jgi:hypothetical protein